MQLVAKIDDLGKPAWIALMIVSFILFWPAGLAILLYLIGSGRMAFWKDAGRGLAGQGKTLWLRLASRLSLRAIDRQPGFR